jgi:hypothetical protein
MSNEEIAFQRGPARRPAVIVSDPMIQWSTGLPTKDRTLYAGWLVEIKDGQDELGAAMLQAGYEPIVIKHGNGQFVSHWALPNVSLFIIADGMQTMAEMKQTQERYGIAFGWKKQDDGRMKSVLRCRVFVRELLQAGYDEPLLLTLSGTITGDFLRGLEGQYATLDAIDALRIEQGKAKLAPPFYALSIPFVAGADVTRGQAGMSKDISPPQAAIPEPVTRAYLTTNYIKAAWVPLIESRLDDTISWSVSESRRIATGDQGGMGDE